MDLEDEGWVNIPYDGLLEVHGEGDEKIFSRKYVNSPANLFKPNYFGTPRKSVQEEPGFGKQLVPLPTQSDHGDEVKEIIKLPILINDEPKEARHHELELDQDPIFQVFFKKENQFVEMKTGSPRLNSRETDLSCIETGPFQYEERSDDHTVNCSSPSKMNKQEVVSWGGRNQRMNIWRWGLSGVGAFCSVGMAAATICILIFGNGRRQNQKLRIQIYSDNKRMKQVVQQANEATSAVRGVPLVKAQITYGGCYESL